MQTQIIGRHLEVTDAIREHAEQRAAKLPRFFDQLSQVEVVVEKRSDHTFFSEFICHVDHHDRVVSHAKEQDLHAAMDAAAGKAERLLHDLKEKQRSHKHSH